MTMLTPRFVGVATTSLCVAMLGGCASTSTGVEASGAYFEGLDPAAVAEVLEDPVRLETLEMFFEPGAEQESAAQAMVVSNIVCRDALRVYEEWTASGERPDFAPAPAPSDPREGYASFVELTYPWIVALADEGDPERLRWGIAEADANCGQYAPAEVGDLGGQRVSERLGGVPRAPLPSEE